MLGCIKAGVVTVPCRPGSAPSVLEAQVATTGASLIIADHLERRDRPDVLRARRPARRGRGPAARTPPAMCRRTTSARDVAFVLWSSETASEPRAVAHTHGAAFASRVQAEHWLDAGGGTPCGALPTGSAQSVWSGLIGPWSRGAEIVHHTGEFDALEQLDLIHRLGVTILCQSPTEYRELADLRSRDLGALPLEPAPPPRLHRRPPRARRRRALRSVGPADPRRVRADGDERRRGERRHARPGPGCSGSRCRVTTSRSSTARGTSFRPGSKATSPSAADHRRSSPATGTRPTRRRARSPATGT